MTDIRQSRFFANFMKDLGWKTEKIKNSYVYLRRFPLLGYFAKVPKITPPLPLTEIDALRLKYNIFQIMVAPDIPTDNRQYKILLRQLEVKKFKVDISPFNPTTDIRFDLAIDEKDIFSRFAEAKRRGVRRAIKNHITVIESDDFESFIKIRKKQYSPVGFLVAPEMRKLWRNFYPANASLLLAYSNTDTSTHDVFSKIPKQVKLLTGKNKPEPVAGILLLFYNSVAYYWYASALKKGKRLFAPTLLVWQALRISQKRGCKEFTFEGIYDERFPKAAKSWKGFTKFKEGFGGKKVVYMENFSQITNPVFNLLHFVM